MKINCCEINTHEICKLMASYHAGTGERPKYLIMSEDTQKLLKADCEIFLTLEQQRAIKGWMIDSKCTSSQCYGIDIAICNKLKLGEVEVV